MFRRYKLVGERVSVVDKEAYDYYTKNSKKRDKTKINQNRYFSKVISSIYEKVEEGIIEYEGGVFAKSFFYITPIKYPQKGYVKLTDGEKLKINMNLHTEGRVYTLLFCNLLTDKKLKPWDMSNTFSEGIKKKLSEKLQKEEVDYKFSLDSIYKTNYDRSSIKRRG